MNAVQEQELIAFHESAHAVAHHCFNLPVASVEIGEDTGRCVPRSAWRVTLSDERNLELAKREVLMQLIIASCAGKAAMDRCYGYKAKSDENWRASSDFKAALSYAILLNNGDEKGAELLLSWLARRAELLVERKWPQIHKLAFALLENEKLSGTEIYEILIRNAETCPTMINKQLR
jgi:hypothetical protein